MAIDTDTEKVKLQQFMYLYLRDIIAKNKIYLSHQPQGIPQSTNIYFKNVVH